MYNSKNTLISLREDIKKYPIGVRLDNWKVICAPGPEFKRFFFVVQ